MASEQSSPSPDFRNQGWIKYLQRLFRKKSFVFGLVMLMIGSGVIKWSWVIPSSTDKLAVVATSEGFRFSQHYNFENPQGGPGFIKKVQMEICDAKTENEFGRFYCDSLKEDDKQKVIFSPIAVEPKKAFPSELYFYEQSELTRQFKTDRFYKIIITYTIIDTFIFITYQRTKTEVYLLSFDEQEVDFFNKVDKDRIGVQNIIPLYRIDN